MKVRLKVSVAALGWAYAPGEVADMPAERAKALIKAGQAEAIAPKRETATKKNIEKRGAK